MDDLAQLFEEHRTRLRAVVYRMLGGKIVAMDFLADPDRLRALDLTILES